MQALIVDHSVPAGVRLGERAAPDAEPNQAVVAVRAVSVNFGDVVDNVDLAADGSVPGWEAAGVVVEAAADGSGPQAGTPVVTFGMTAAWAQLRSVDTCSLAVLPQGLDFGSAATIPVAGVSALSALERLGPLLGRRVLVTGASGGVGRYAVQLARLGGADVIAMTGSPARNAAMLHDLGAGAVVETPAAVGGPLDGVIDTVGGSTLVSAFGQLGRNGTLVSVGHVTEQTEAFPANAFLTRPGQDDRAIRTFFMPEATADLPRSMAWLGRRLHDGALRPGITWRGPWTDAAHAIGLLRERRLSGKAVLDVPPV
ncbi:zinc-binding dehydrogenase [Microbacterium sp. NPDC055683]